MLTPPSATCPVPAQASHGQAVPPTASQQPSAPAPSHPASPVPTVPDCPIFILACHSCPLLLELVEVAKSVDGFGCWMEAPREVTTRSKAVHVPSGQTKGGQEPDSKKSEAQQGPVYAALTWHKPLRFQ